MGFLCALFPEGKVDVGIQQAPGIFQQQIYAWRSYCIILSIMIK